MKDLRGFSKEANSAKLPSLSGLNFRPKPKPLSPARKAKKAAKKLARKARKFLRDKQMLAAAGVQPLGAPHPDYVQGDDSFYKSREWRALRYVALKNSEGRCHCCGAQASDGAKLHVDHIIPRYRAPHLSLDIKNLQILCEDCNIGKGGWDDTNWRQHFKSI